MSKQSKGQAQRVIEEFWRIQDAGDYTRLAPLFAEDAVLDDPVHGRFEGRAKILEFMTMMVREMGERKISFSLDEVCGDDHAAWARWTMHTGAGQSRGSRGGVGIYKVENGLMTYYRDYVDPEVPE